ncbi:MAG TPA: cytidine deaminase [Bacteroidales bacterium]|nr:MAG: cytidine deaminase [Bacteroidetes bacterium GWF2_33_38]OFY88213.1 MAG: cytidine deaminase [Bacteroidetes bacterium RIFOXYA2_FULL_33_7]HBF87565.1 cytidine deaminase [Bacteroidales bacterium]
MKEVELKISIQEYDNVNELSNDDQVLIERAKRNVETAYSPYSHFGVGAAVLLDNGEIIDGNNQENAAYPSGLCAERVAMFYANSKYPKAKPLTIAVTAKTKGHFVANPIPPCGSCRQVLLETESRFKSDLRIILVGENKIQVLKNVKSLLPLSFDGGFLKV